MLKSLALHIDESLCVSYVAANIDERMRVSFTTTHTELTVSVERNDFSTTSVGRIKVHKAMLFCNKALIVE